MTIKTARSILLNWFVKSDTYNEQADFNKIVLITETPTEDRASVHLALESLSKEGIISNSVFHWILVDQLKQKPQLLEISPEVAEGMESTINQFAEQTEDISECNQNNLGESDVISLLCIIDMLMASLNENYEDEGCGDPNCSCSENAETDEPEKPKKPKKDKNNGEDKK